MFDKILIANRGEIACRIIKTAQQMGVHCVAVYSGADKNAKHVALADEAFYIGSAQAKESYLSIEKILQVAEQCGAQAVHPGYGFLAENAKFARACIERGLVFIGPPVESIEAMGSKSAAKEIMSAAGVPLVPGYHGDNQDAAYLKEQSVKIGYPQLLKATYGGGGKGMRVVLQEADFDAALAATKRESMASFGNDGMLIERYLTKPRHVEIQVFADNHDNCIYLAERDCSIQRRHQKVIEEAPAPDLSPQTRLDMGIAAVAAARAINYQGAGTVEFLLDEDGSFYFMEMNTRLQVEHPVTEMITGQDLVAWQLKVASGQLLPLTQEQVTVEGHAIEVRIYAEDPEHDFIPAAGQLTYLRQPQTSKNVRVDTGVRQNDEVSSFYDPMIAKLIVWDESRDRAIQRLLRALDEYRIGGLKTNLGFLTNLVGTQPFKQAELDTGFIDRHHDLLFCPATQTNNRALALAALVILLEQSQLCADLATAGNDPFSPWSDSNGWRLNECQYHHIKLTDASNLTHDIEVVQQQENYLFNFEGNKLIVRGELIDDHLTAVIDGHKIGLLVDKEPDQITLYIKQDIYKFQIIGQEARNYAPEESESRLTAPMNGTIVSVPCEPNQKVNTGDALVIMEAMKMEYTIVAPYVGIVSEIFFETGDMVAEGTLLIELTVVE